MDEIKQVVSMLRPGILVSLKTTLKGGVSYDRKDVETEHTNGGGESVATWETTRRIDDPDEHARAVKVRSLAANLIRGICAHTAFGLLCTAEREGELDGVIKQAREAINLFNAQAQGSQVHVYILKGRVAATDEEAARAIASEVESILGDMQAGIRNLDAKAVREAASRAKQVGAVLGSEQQTKVSMAIEIARSAAREIVKRAEKGGEDAAKVLADLSGQSAAIEVARIAFLDFDAPTQPAGEALPATVARDMEIV